MAAKSGTLVTSQSKNVHIVELLIEMVRNYLALYDKPHPKHKDSLLKDDLWNKIGNELGLTGIDARLEGKCEPGPSFPAGTLKNACTVGFQGRSGETLMLSEVGGKDTELDSLDDCQVTIQGCPATLFARRLRNCHIRCGPVASSVFVEECESCTFLVACHQLRVHDSLKCEFRVHVQTRSIIEDSNELLFGKYDFVYDGDEQDWCASHLDRTVNNWNKVDDFNWLAADKPSPNWELSRV
ncbi:hypothetical protein HPB52_025500 [Rhipicephalus sanguineus]|uniref:C-CAP/cofactor C-like domain-containing protein n=1 Tax=Rhipicephalus sanguineus TaxID=34632 RepID=A0A9D4PAN5_RHISA|nr:hypothetical protein HPB52_025500 [Rhipicephalus sanguineus]